MLLTLVVLLRQFRHGSRTEVVESCGLQSGFTRIRKPMAVWTRGIPVAFL